MKILRVIFCSPTSKALKELASLAPTSKGIKTCHDEGNIGHDDFLLNTMQHHYSLSKGIK